MENENKFVKIAIDNGYGYYEILITVFLNKFKFLRESEYGAYESVNYSWSAQEHVIEVYSERTKIKIIFLEEGGNLEIYFQKRCSIFSVKTVSFSSLETVKKIAVPNVISLETVEDVLIVYAQIFKEHLGPILRGSVKF